MAEIFRSSFGCSWFENISLVDVPSLRLFCFPHAGGSANVFRKWRQGLPKEVDISLVHLPGRDRNRCVPLYRRLVPLVAAVADRIASMTKVPYVLYGHSMGALIAFELTRELYCRNSSGPKRLIVSGCPAPQCPREEPPTFDLPRDEFVGNLRRLKGTPAEVLDNLELMDIFIDLLRADFEMVGTYKYRPGDPLSCPITVYGGLQDENVTIESCHAWKRQSTACSKVRMFKGDHFFVCSPGPEFMNVFRSDILAT